MGGPAGGVLRIHPVAHPPKQASKQAASIEAVASTLQAGSVSGPCYWPTAWSISGTSILTPQHICLGVPIG